MKQKKAASTYVALLRGINLAGKNKLSMKDLTSIFAQAGCNNVRTYIQSGNVVFHASPPIAQQLPAQIAQQIEERFGFRIPVLLRTTEQLASVIRNNPYLRAGTPQEQLHVYFLAQPSQASHVAQLDPNRSAPDVYCLRGQEIYLQLPNGMARTKLTNAYFDARLFTTCTARNWNTVLKLFELMQES
ncbi:MAG TPA: DUF1697 domain-containing protein [Acidobacteriaceae bacterium]|nr:DUF1697 domain-containing protein [Acidobacteriaceae bacterium]